LVSTGKCDLLATTREGGWTALHTAVDLDDANITRILLPTFPNIYLPPHQVLAALRQPTESSCAVTALHMAVRRNSTSCAVVLLQTANALVHGHSGGWSTSEDEDDSVFAEKVQQRREFHGQAEDGSRKLNKLQDSNGDTPLHWAVKTNKLDNIKLIRLI
uniref:ANK_REP_REGION domain-containing protein n=1 Tax=Rodentolepis nana TaxID=102285 RepID=A0A0R3TDJ7_RODNA